MTNLKNSLLIEQILSYKWCYYILWSVVVSMETNRRHHFWSNLPTWWLKPLQSISIWNLQNNRKFSFFFFPPLYLLNEKRIKNSQRRSFKWTFECKWPDLYLKQLWEMWTLANQLNRDYSVTVISLITVIFFPPSILIVLCKYLKKQ